MGMYQNKVSAGKVCTPTAAHTYCRSNEIWHHRNIYQRWAFSYNAGALWHNRCNKTAAVAEMFMRVSVREDTCPVRKVWVQHVIFKLQAKACWIIWWREAVFHRRKLMLLLLKLLCRTGIGDGAITSLNIRQREWQTVFLYWISSIHLVNWSRSLVEVI